MPKTIVLIIIMLISGITLVAVSQEEKHSMKPIDGFVPNEATAIKIAEAIWLPIYGDKIYQEKPLKAILRDRIWFVSGTLPMKYTIGGVDEAEISQDDGRILRVSHGK